MSPKFVRVRAAGVLATVLAVAVLASTLLIGCGSATKGATVDSPPADTIAGQVYAKMNVKAGDAGDAVIARVKEVAAGDENYAMDPNVTIGVGADAKTTFAIYTFKDGSTLKLTYKTATGLPADNKLVGAEFTKK